ncbi:CvpA family protein [Candidatus Uhrbacteria bacterium]|nr:CvpA family protein [Candidatus Uhrbacteria bacterium]
MGLTVLNILLVLFLVGFISLGFKDGLIQTFGRLVGAVIGFIAARSWSSWISGVLAIALPMGWARFIAFVVVFGVASRVVGIVFHLVDAALRIVTFLPFIKTVNKLLGGVLGIVEGVLMIGGVLWAISTYQTFPAVVALIQQSPLARLFLTGFETLLRFVM